MKGVVAVDALWMIEVKHQNQNMYSGREYEWVPMGRPNADLDQLKYEIKEHYEVWGRIDPILEHRFVKFDRK